MISYIMLWIKNFSVYNRNSNFL